MAGTVRSIGIVGFFLGVGLACTQLFGDRQNTLAPATTAPPTTGMPRLQPRSAGPEICTQGQTRCEGALLQTCSDDHSSWVTIQRCGAAALCQSNPATCLAATCSAEEMSCAGAVLQKCNADRTGWDVFDTCLSPAHCNADLRQCLPEACAPGTRRCDRSDGDQSPVLEVCNDDRSDWAPLDSCVTRELCDQTLTSGGAPGGLVLGSDGMLQLQDPATPATVLKCNLPACAVGEVRCDGPRLEYCSEGRTGWITAEECASEALCTGSLNNVTAAGVPACLPPVCSAGQHRCTETGMLQVCSEDRSGFRDQEQCIGAPFCNSLIADQGQSGCRDAPCEAGQMQCNGAQIQVCREDRTALDDLGPPCESAALCNADDPSNAFCEPPVCHRGATAGDEFQCQGAELQRCNESLTVYDTIQTCVTPALCDASQRFNGCKRPACQPGEHACNGGFLQTCNADQTGFENTENCGSQAQCDANAGRCADPCEPGTNRCNNATGDLEICRDRLVGWQPIADCPNVALCDLANNRCDICLGGQFSCADNQLRQCSPDGGTFSRQNIGPECAATPDGRAGVRLCQNNQVVVTPCEFGCSNGRCNECQGNQTQCVGNSQIRRCVNGFYGAPTSCSDGNACNGAETCQNNQCTGSPAPTCNDNNPCTSDSCVAPGGCQFNPFSGGGQCINNGSQAQSCVNGQLQTVNCTQGFGCTTGRCNTCNQGACANGTQFQTCDNGQLSAPRNCPTGQVCQGGGNCVFNCQQLNCEDNNPCTNDTCSAQQGCVHTNNNNSCSDGNVCNGAETCGNGTCNRGAAAANGTQCGNGNVCQNGQCVPPPPAQICTPGSFTACANNNTAFTRCNALGTANNELVACAGGQTCDAAQRRCVTPVAPPPPPPPAQACTPLDTICQNGVPVRCRADGSGFDVFRCTAGGINVVTCNGNTISSTQCTGSNVNGCVDLACVDGECIERGNSSIQRSCTNRAFGAASTGGHCSGGTCSIEGCNTPAECTVAGAQCVMINPTPNTGFPGQCVPSP
ncbi:MAG TPA: hypothetical protein VFS67_03145 [Polyangiaceae bacterium]|nr:hypothetical protein [Polyangiaceae bacterium]